MPNTISDRTTIENPARAVLGQRPSNTAIADLRVELDEVARLHAVGRLPAIGAASAAEVSAIGGRLLRTWSALAVADDLTPKQQSFADLVLGGMPASRAYRDAGYSARTDGSAEACASRLLSSAKVTAYLARHRAAAAEKAELTLAGILWEVAEFARDKAVEPAQRLGAFKLLSEQLARLTRLANPIADSQGEVSEARVAALALGVLEAAMAGRLPIAQALEIVQAARTVIEPIAAATLARELRAETGPPTPEPLAPRPSDPRTRPAWLKPAQVVDVVAQPSDAA